MSVTSREKLVRKLKNKEYRDAFVENHVKMGIPAQIRAIRGDLSQGEFGERVGMRQNAISRLESDEYGNLNVNTLIRLASGCDMGLLVRFVPFSKLVREVDDYSLEAIVPENFENDLEELEAWKDEQPDKAQDSTKVLIFPTDYHPATFGETPLQPELAGLLKPVEPAKRTVESAKREKKNIKIELYKVANR